MHCALTILKNIGMFAGFTAVISMIGAALFLAACLTTYLFGWVESPGPTMGVFFVYMVILGGAVAGWEECRGW